MGGWWRLALVSLDGVAHSPIVSVSASVNLPLHQKSRSSLLAPAHPGGPGKRAVKGCSGGGGLVLLTRTRISKLVPDLTFDNLTKHHHAFITSAMPPVGSNMLYSLD